MRKIKVQNNQNKYLKGLICFLGLTLVGLTVFSTIDRVTAGAEITKLVQTQDLLVKEKSELKAKLIDLSSLNLLEGKASSLGYLKPQRTVYINKVEEGVAARLP